MVFSKTSGHVIIKSTIISSKNEAKMSQYFNPGGVKTYTGGAGTVV